MVMSRFLIMHIFAILFSVGAMDRAYKGTPSGGQPGECIDCHRDRLEYESDAYGS